MTETETKRYNVSLPEKEKEKYDAFAASENLSFSGLVRVAIKEYMRKQQSQSVPAIANNGIASAIEVIETRLEKRFETLENTMNKFTPAPPADAATHDQQLKIIFANIKSHPEGIETGALVECLPWDRATVTALCLELRAGGKIAKKRNTWVVT